ncbi:MAG: bifunctional transaldolase/phosoglucose isomerase [Gemmatimonadales bacterium]
MADLFASLPEALRAAAWQKAEGTRRLWAKDATLWTGADESKWLGWLDVVRAKPAEVALDDKIEHVLVLGMGGSSLCPYVLASTFGPIKGRPRLHVLDSTDPAQIRAAESAAEPARSLFIVASKSGSTLEPNILRDYFLDRAGTGSRFIAITDPGSQLEKQARADGFRAIVHGVPSIGGRFSALSAFGMVPAGLMGLDVAKLMGRAATMADACGPASGPEEKNPGVALGIIMGEAALHGMDKLTIVAASAVSELGAWLEQLVAESTGKRGKAIIPVDKEGVRPPEAYGEDRLFVSLQVKGEADPAHEAAVGALQRAGRPLVRLVLQDRYDLGAEFFRWEIATAVAGAVMGINAFDQPDVEAAKIEARRLTDEVEKTGALPPETPIAEDRGIRLFADPANAAALAKAPRTLEGMLRAHFARLGRGDYFALQAYVDMNEEHEAALQALRGTVLGRRRVATTLGFGPRFLHSTGQAHKGGPNTGVFLQVTCEDARDLPVPGRRYTFGVVKAAQARGDAAVLAARGRRFLRVHLPPAVPEALRVLGEAVERALA